MDKLNIADRVQMKGVCRCTPRAVQGSDMWFDVRDCYHKPNTVRHVFEDETSAWVRNRYGYARRIQGSDLIPGRVGP